MKHLVINIAKKLGAEEVTMAYRRGPDQMKATWKERDFAQKNGVKIKYWVVPKKLYSENGHVSGVEFECTELGSNGETLLTGENRTVEADIVYKAIGQLLENKLFAKSEIPEIKNGKIAVNSKLETSIPYVWAGGDCINLGEDLTVQAVEDGKQAAIAINEKLTK